MITGSSRPMVDVGVGVLVCVGVGVLVAVLVEVDVFVVVDVLVDVDVLVGVPVAVTVGVLVLRPASGAAWAVAPGKLFSTASTNTKASALSTP
jgi:hypothetical protein